MYIAVYVDVRNGDVDNIVVGKSKEEAIEGLREVLVKMMEEMNDGFDHTNIEDKDLCVYESEDIEKTKNGTLEELQEQWVGDGNAITIYVFEVPEMTLKR